MSMLDKLKSLLQGHEDQTQKAADKAGDTFNERTGNKYQSQTDTVKQKLDEQLGDQQHPTDDQQ